LRRTRKRDHETEILKKTTGERVAAIFWISLLCRTAPNCAARRLENNRPDTPTETFCGRVQVPKYVSSHEPRVLGHSNVQQIENTTAFNDLSVSERYLAI
jgi:hypothetical protein